MLGNLSLSSSTEHIIKQISNVDIHISHILFLSPVSKENLEAVGLNVVISSSSSKIQQGRKEIKVYLEILIISYH